MTTSNIELFDEYTGQIFVKLYQSFPVPTDVNPYDFIVCARIGLQNDEFAYGNDHADIFLATSKWLVMAGYIHCNEARDSYLKGAVLTAKGLEVLKATPASVTKGASLGDRLTSAAKQEGRETLQAVVSEALSLGAKLLSPLLGLPV